MRSYLTPIQLGVGVSTATELITHCVKETLDSNPEKFLLQVDLSNAFNSLHRRTMLKAVDRAAPALSAFCHYLYDTPHLFFVALQYYPHAKVSNKGTHWDQLFSV